MRNFTKYFLALKKHNDGIYGMQRALIRFQRYVKQLKRSTIIYSKNRVYILSIVLHKLFQNISFLA